MQQDPCLSSALKLVHEGQYVVPFRSATHHLRICDELQVEARIMKQTPGTMRAVICPKAAAVENFERDSSGAPLTFSLLCSSVSAVAGYSGQVCKLYRLPQSP